MKTNLLLSAIGALASFALADFAERQNEYTFMYIFGGCAIALTLLTFLCIKDLYNKANKHP